MNVKQLPEDFRVVERTTLRPDSGRFAFYRLTKTNWTTFDALEVIRRRWDIERARVSYGGLKDRHAETVQYLTIYQGPQRNLEHQRLRLDFLGMVRQPYSSQDIEANQFVITIRGLDPVAVEQAATEVPLVCEVGVPNYFDDQRFGSVGPDRRFIAAELVHGRFESAVKMALAGDYEFDRAEDKQIKAILHQHWGRWAECKAELPRSSARSIVDYLVHHPMNFRGAFARLKPELTSLYLSAYQSYLWNEMASQWLQSHLDSQQLAQIRLKLGDYPAPKHLSPEALAIWREAVFPFPSARIKANESAEWYQALQPVLTREGITLDQIRIRGLDKPYFSRGERALALLPQQLQHSSAADELNPKRHKLVLSFELPRGAYATMVVKRLLQSEQVNTGDGEVDNDA